MFLFTTSVFAQDGALNAQSPVPVFMEFPSVAINSILMNEYEYVPGREVSFSVDLENISKSPNQYTQSIVLYENNPDVSDKKIIHVQRGSEVFIFKPGERANKKLTYTIPSFVKGNIILTFVLSDTAGNEINRKDVFLVQSLSSAGTSVESKVQKTITSFVTSASLVQDEGGTTLNLLSKKVEQSTEQKVFEASKDIYLRLVTTEALAGGRAQVVYGTTTEYVSIRPETIVKIKPKIGDTLLSVSLFDSSGVLVAPSLVAQVIVEGMRGSVEAFGIHRDGKVVQDVKKGETVTVYLHWIPEVYARNKDDLLTNPIFNTLFTAYVYMYDVSGSTDSASASLKLIGSSTVSEIGIQTETKVRVLGSSSHVLGKVIIRAGDYTVAEYQKVLVFSPEKSMLEVVSIALGSLVVLVVALFMYTILRKRNTSIASNQSNTINQSGKSNMYILYICAGFFALLPVVTHAQWQAVTSGVLNHYYPREIDSSTTTWSTVLISSYPYNYSIPAFSQACPANATLTGATSNYVSINNPLVSSNGKAYRWEYSWYPTRNSGTSVFNLPNWFSVQEQYAGSGSGYRYPTYPVRDARPIIPSTYLYSQSAFVDQKAFNRTAQITDNLFSSWNSEYSTGWNRYRPFRFSVSSSLYSALATSTYSNLIPWLEARFNSFDRRVDNISDSGLGYLNYSLLSNMIPGSYVAASGRLFYSIFSNPFGLFTNATTSSLLQSTGYTDQDLLFNFDAGSFMNTYSPGMGNLGIGSSYFHRLGAYPEYGTSNTRLDCVAPYNSVSCKNADRSYLEGTYSRPGTYNLMNILVTSRLGGLVPINFDGRGSYQCQSSNAQVYMAPYEVVDNSYIAVVMFNDENADGIKQSSEKTIVSADNFSEGYLSSIDNGSISKNHGLSTTCSVPTVSSRNRQLPFYYATSTSQIAKMYDEKISSAGYQYTAPVPYVRTDAQVINPTYLARFSSTSPSLAINNVTIGGYQTVDTPNYWIQNSGMGSYDFSRQYDSQGRLRLNSITQNCGHVTLTTTSLGIVTSGTSTLTAEEFSKQTSQYPLSSDVANTYTAYSKFAVNSELSPTYTVGIDPNTLSSGWTRTKEASASGFEKTVTVTEGNQNHIVYLGVTYSSPGVCGSATTTVSQTTTPPTTNLCSAGSSTAVVTNDQNFTWNCNGIGSGFANASCTKPKCPTANPYYCAATNACVSDVSACTIAGVCGSATLSAGKTTEGAPVTPSSNLCSVGSLNGTVAGQSDPVSSFTWTCLGQNGGATSATCSQPKCSTNSGLRYCASVNECRTSCPVTGSSTLIFNSKLNPWVVRDRNSTCLLTWNVAASQDLPVACTLSGVSIGDQSSVIQRTSPVSVGNATLTCTNGQEQQSTTTKCLLNPAFREI